MLFLLSDLYRNINGSLKSLHQFSKWQSWERSPEESENNLKVLIFSVSMKMGCMFPQKSPVDIWNGSQMLLRYAKCHSVTSSPPKIRCDAVLKFTVLDSFVACNPETCRLYCCPSWHIRVSQRERQWAVAKSVTLMSCVSQQHPTHCSLDLQHTKH